MVNSADFTKRINKIMEKNDLNASSFAEAINVGRSSISHILSGRNKPSLDFVMSIVSQFPEVDLYWLLNGKGTYPKNEQINSPQINSNIPATNVAPVATKTESTTIEEQTISTTPNLFSSTHNAENDNSQSIRKGKNITKVIILYSDGSFKDYVPE